MYTKTTKSINITVNPCYLDEQSEPEDHHYVWAYQITINNLSQETVQLKNRYFSIEVVKCLNCGLVFDCSDIDSIELNNYISKSLINSKKTLVKKSHFDIFIVSTHYGYFMLALTVWLYSACDHSDLNQNNTLSERFMGQLHYMSVFHRPERWCP